MRPQAIIVGGGIGGLSAAICLSTMGWRVRVLEQAAEMSEIGAGVQISPNGVKILEKIGVMPLLEAHLFEPETIEIRMGISGRKLLDLPMKAVATHRWGARYIQIHRADLIAALSARLSGFQGCALQTGATVTGYRQTKEGADVVLANNSVVSGNLVIGADGIHSAIRRQMLGPDAPRFTGNIAWRALVPVALLGELAPPSTGCIWAGRHKHAVTTRVRAGAVVNFVGIVEQTDWLQEDWKTEGAKKDALSDFQGWDPRILTVIQEADNLHKWALFDRAPLPRWHEKHVVLLGDSAHPMLPSMAQGAVQSIEDAYVLTQCLTVNHKDIPSACSAYFDQRIKRTTRVQKASARNLKLFHKPTLPAQLLSYAPIWVAGKFTPSLVQRRNDWLYGQDLIS